MIKCTNPRCNYFPHYGVAPHTCFFRRGPGYKIGESTPIPREQWPKNFQPDDEDDGGGMYYCPTCFYGMPKEVK